MVLKNGKMFQRNEKVIEQVPEDTGLLIDVIG